ncbi:Uu.00g129010.m01.CDS01 [Anthostomella pinea]|uniref:Uu.00g129010.m01.CDS01 n=1 Tax=Anthostomella pinea TaxID=933095 RepID=A0AAI8YI59_9PEZI|nr:Uu.00g129010.m01.CDS01 [Anthostomella pinea]
MAPPMRAISSVRGLFCLALLAVSTTGRSVARLSTRACASANAAGGRERISINDGWRFSRFTENPDGLSYEDNLKEWILPQGNDFIVNGTKHTRPSGTAPGADVEYVQAFFDDSAWEKVNLPHDWAIKGPFGAPNISTSEGSLPVNGVGWYRRNLSEAETAAGKSVFLDIDGAMSYAAVWLNGELVGGWPYGYASFRLDLTPYLKGSDNTLAIRLDNPLDSSRWYPGAGIYRNVWLVTADETHVSQYGTYATTPEVTSESATVNLVVSVENKGSLSRQVGVVTKVYPYDAALREPGSEVVASFTKQVINVAAGTKQSVRGSVTVTDPLLWGPVPSQTPNLYVAMTTLTGSNGTVIDTYSTRFGIRSIEYVAEQGLLVNGEHVYLQGTCNHHDLGSLGAAFNYRATHRQLEMLQEMGVNALRTSHNPPAPEFLEMADEMGFVVMDELFDVWLEPKVTNDYNVLFADWHEADLRSFLRRDRNHASVVAWSFGNEIPEQSSADGRTLARSLQAIILSEEPTRQTSLALNSAKPGTGLPDTADIIGLNYQGEGQGTTFESAFPAFHAQYPDKMIWSTETSSVLSTRGTYIFPVVGNSSTTVGVGPSPGWDEAALTVSAYELYAPSWGSSPDKVFAQQDRYPYVAGEFVWTGFDYLGEPTPYDTGARSSYFGIIDLAGFKKDRFYLYQARWRANLPMAHLLPHWSFGAERMNRTTPVHVFSSGDEAELFVNGVSKGRKVKEEYEYRFRWDDVVYTPGEIKVVAYKDGAVWAEDSKRTVGAAAQLNVTVDRATIDGDGRDLAFVTVAVVDADGDVVPEAANAITFALEGPGEIVSTDNGDPRDMTPFPSPERNAFSGYALAIVRADRGAVGEITLSASADGLVGGEVVVQAA